MAMMPATASAAMAAGMARVCMCPAPAMGGRGSFPPRVPLAFGRLGSLFEADREVDADDPGRPASGSAEDDRLVAVHQHPVLDVGQDGSGQDDLLEVTSLAHQVLDV